MKGSFLTFEKFGNRDPGSIGSSRIRARWVMKYWPEVEEWHVGRDYSFVIFQKSFWPQYILGDWEANYHGFEGIKIFDESDPSWLENDAFMYYNACDAVTTSTPALAEYIKKILPNKIIECIPDRIDMAEHQDRKISHSVVVKNLAWFGYSTNYHYLEQTFPILNKKKMILHCYSDSGIEVGSAYPDLQVIWHKYNYETLHKELIQYDAVVLPEERGRQDFRGRFKSNNKFLTAYALGIPVISVPEDFDRLASQGARIKEAQEKREMVVRDYDVKKSVAEYKTIIERIKDAKKGTR
jgi:hypothetical protein